MPQVQVTAFRERLGDKDLIEVDLIVEANSQKGIVIGKGASALKQLGMRARADIEAFLGAPPPLHLHLQHWLTLQHAHHKRSQVPRSCNGTDAAASALSQVFKCWCAEREVHLELSVRVQPKWRKSSASVTKYGY